MSKDNRNVVESKVEKVSVFALKGIIKIIVLVLLGILLLRTTVYVYNLSYNLFSDKPNITGEKRDYSIEITPDTTVDRVAEVLYINGIISDKVEFKLRAKLSKLKTTMKTGIHRLNSYMTGEEIMDTLSEEGEVPSGK